MEKSSVGIVPVKCVRVTAREAKPVSAASSEGNYKKYIQLWYQEVAKSIN